MFIIISISNIDSRVYSVVTHCNIVTKFVSMRKVGEYFLHSEYVLRCVKQRITGAGISMLYYYYTFILCRHTEAYQGTPYNR